MTAWGGYLTAAELAELALPGLPATKEGILYRARKERWHWIERRGRGGTARAYFVDHLPEEARQALARRRIQAPANLRPVGRPRGSDFFTRHPAVADAVEAILAGQQLAAQRVLELLSCRFSNLPSRRTLARFIARLEREKPAVLASFRDPDAYKSKYRLALGRKDGGVVRANQIWEIDSTKADVLTKAGRKTVLGLIDVYSRRARFMVCDSESSQSVRRLLRDTIHTWGVRPEVLRTDNGAGFINASLVSGLGLLGIEPLPVRPAAGDEKPFVERLFGTFTRERAELLAGYCGHNVAEAQALRQRARKETGRAVIVPELEPDELQAIIDAWTDGVYHQRRHSRTGEAPIARWLASPAPSIRAPSEGVLRVALSALIGPAKVTKRGVRWKGVSYWSPALAPFVGRVVQLRRDEDDLGVLYVFDEDDNFIDTAVNHGRRGLSEQAFAAEARRQQAEWMTAQRAELRAKKREFSIERARDALLRRDAEAAGRLTALPARTVERQTRQLQSIAAGLDRPQLETALDKATPRRPAPPARSPAEKVAEADRIIAAAEAGVEVDPADLTRARLYAGTSEYRAEKLIAAAFGGGAQTQQQRTHQQRRSA